MDTMRIQFDLQLHEFNNVVNAPSVDRPLREEVWHEHIAQYFSSS